MYDLCPEPSLINTDWAQARMLKDVDVDSLVKKDFDGATILGSKYVPPSVPGYEGVVEEGLKIYNGSCHCGAVSYTVKSKPLEEMEIISCNCSLCSRVRHNQAICQSLLTEAAEKRFIHLPPFHGRSGSWHRESDRVLLRLIHAQLL
jgi:hypothetical protein